MPPPQSSVIVLVIVTVPKPPGSRQSISPPAAVLEIAPANVLHGAVRLHGFASSPTPEIQVRRACALAGNAISVASTNAASTAQKRTSLVILTPLVAPNCAIANASYRQNPLQRT